MYDFRKFVLDVAVSYEEFNSDSLVNQNNDLIIIVDGQRYLIAASRLKEYYNAFKNTNIPYIEWASKTVDFISQEIESWYKKWH